MLILLFNLANRYKFKSLLKKNKQYILFTPKKIDSSISNLLKNAIFVSSKKC